MKEPKCKRIKEVIEEPDTELLTLVMWTFEEKEQRFQIIPKKEVSPRKGESSQYFLQCYTYESRGFPRSVNNVKWVLKFTSKVKRA